MSEVLKKIKEYMKERDLQQQQMAKLLDISISHMSKIMNGHQEPGPKIANNYYKLPGVKEKESIQRAKSEVNYMYVNDQISPEALKKILKALQYDSDN